MLMFDSKKLQDSTTRTLVLKSLSAHFPQSIAELHKSLRTDYRRKLSYQAVRKIVRKLLSERVLEIKNRKYLVSKRWLVSTRREIDTLLVRYQREQPSETPISTRIESDYGTYNFTSLYALDNFWGDLVLDYCSRVRVREKPTYYSINPYAWFMLINLGRETNFWTAIKRFGFSVEMVFGRRCALNTWAAKVYSHVGVKALVRQDPAMDESLSYNIVGDLVLQARISKAAVAAIHSCFTANRRVEQIAPAALHHLAHSNFEGTLSIFRNPSLAQTLRASMVPR